MIPDHLRLHPGQEALTPEQEAEAQRFAQERIEAQLSTEPVDEAETEALLREAYLVAGLPPPESIRWLDGPLELLAAPALPGPEDRDMEVYLDHIITLWDLFPTSIEATIGYDALTRRWQLLFYEKAQHIEASAGERLFERVWDCVGERLYESAWNCVGASIQGYGNVWLETGAWASIPAYLRDPMQAALRHRGCDCIVDALRTDIHESVQAYQMGTQLAVHRFFDTYLAPNDLHALAHFNERVSGYWPGRKGAVLLRRPCLLLRDQEGRLHSEQSMALEYPDGWGFYAWHGVRVPEQVILAPERLARQEYLCEPNVEVRRVIQERMGERFVAELGGVVLDTGPRGTLYEVVLPDDPEGVARYVQVQDASSERRYMLRVPPTIQTAAEAVAWTFQVAAEDYRPAQET